MQLVNEGREYYDSESWADAHRKYSEAIEAEHNYRDAYINRGELYARFGLWEHMAADFDMRFQLAKLGNPVTHLEHALLRAYVNDKDGHRGSLAISFLPGRTSRIFRSRKCIFSSDTAMINSWHWLSMSTR